MTYGHFEHEADVGIRGKGKTVEEAFQEAAKAMFDVEVDVEKVRAVKKVNVECEAANVEELFIEWLNALLSQASLRNMIFSEFKVKIIKDKKMKLVGDAKGEKFDPEKHNIKDEVKGATYSQLKVFQDKKTKKWIAQCIVDV